MLPVYWPAETKPMLSARPTRINSALALTHASRPSTRAPMALNTSAYRKLFAGFGASPASRYAASTFASSSTSSAAGCAAGESPARVIFPFPFEGRIARGRAASPVAPGS